MGKLVYELFRRFACLRSMCALPLYFFSIATWFNWAIIAIIIANAIMIGVQLEVTGADSPIMQV